MRHAAENCWRTIPVMADLPFQRGTPTDWDEGTKAFDIRGDGDQMELYGPCPRCHHELTKSLALVIGTAWGGDLGELKTLGVICNCGQPHEGRGPDDSGCGARGGVTVRL